MIFGNPDIRQALVLLFDTLTHEAHGNSVGKGFWDDHTRTLSCLAPDLKADYLVTTRLAKIALMQSELGEAVEAIRKPHADEHCPAFTNEAVELADCVIRILDYCGRFEIDLGSALLAKMEFNKSRPHKHGKLA